MIAEKLNEIVRHIECGELIFFVGAGISIAEPSCLIGFQDLQNEILWALHCQLKEELRTHYRKIYEDIQGRLYRLSLTKKVLDVPPEYIFELCKLDLEASKGDIPYFAQEPLNIFRNAIPNHNHLTLANLLITGSIPAVITTNFDTLIEQAAMTSEQSKVCHQSIIVKKSLDDFNDKKQLNSNLIKLHGCISDPSSIITSLSDVGKRAALQKYDFLKDILQRYVVLFAGYRGADIDVFTYLAGSNIKKIIWNTRSGSKILDKINVLLQNTNSEILEIDLNILFKKLRNHLNLPEFKVSCNPDVIQRINMDPIFDWAAYATSPSIILVLGDYWEYLGEWNIARQFFLIGEAEFSSKGDNYLENIFLSRQGALHYKLGDFEKAKIYCHKCLDKSKLFLPGNRLYEYVTTYQLLAMIEARTNPKSAINIFYQILAYQDQLEQIDPKMRYRRAILLLNAGNVLYSVSYLDYALGFYKNALTLFDESGNIDGRARVLHNLGNIYRDQGKLDDSIRHYHEAEYLFKETSSIIELGGVYLSLAKVYKAKQLLGNVQFYAKEALIIFEMLGNKDGIERSKLFLKKEI